MITRINMNTQAANFKGYVPVRIYLKDKTTKSYYPMADDKSVKNCGGQLVRNLNGTLKKLTLPEFVDLYKTYDKDYTETPKACALYSKFSSDATLVTGNDAKKLEEKRQNIKLKIENSKKKYGNLNSYEAKTAKRSYVLSAKRYLEQSCTPLKQDGEKLTLEVYFEPQYFTKGEKKGEIKGFQYKNAKFLKESEMKDRPLVLSIAQAEGSENIKEPVYRQMNIYDFI